MPHTANLPAQDDAAPLRTAMTEAAGMPGDVRVREALDQVLGRLHPVPDRADVAAAAALMPEPRAGMAGPIGLIVETRRHLNLPFVVRQVVQRCGIPVQLMHGPGNAAFVHARLGDLIDSGQVITSLLGGDRLNGSAYNGLFLSRAFWHAMLGRGKVFVFQTDSMLCHRSVHRLENFLDFDFIGSRRRLGGERRHVLGGLNGGFSLRDWDRSVYALENFAPERWPAGEDDFFPFFIEACGGRVARAAESDRFCGQRWFERGCFGLHKPNWRKPRLAIAVLGYEPGAWRLVTPIEKRLARGQI